MNETSNKNNQYIIVTRTSMDGIEALKSFFNAMPTGSGMAFAVIIHHNLSHISLLTEILSKHTSMAVVAIEEGTQVKANHIYISSSQHVSLNGEALNCGEVNPTSGMSLPIDFFFRTLAKKRKDKAICIVLSRSGSDGTLGLHSIKGESGMAMVQEAQSAQFSDMTSDTAPTGFHELALKYDLHACWGQPILSEQGKPVGAFTTYYKHAHHPSKIEEPLINQTLPLMGLFIDHYKEATR